VKNRGFFTGRILRKAIGAAAVLGFLSALLVSQEIAVKDSSIATVTFTLDFPHSNPEHYSIAVDSTGHTRFECKADADDETYRSEFDLSAGTRDRIFDWSKQAKYFAGSIDSGNRKLAFSGTKILSYEDSAHNNTQRYNYSNQAPVRDLTNLFQNLASTLEYGRRLTYDHRYQKLALDDELKRMEDQARNNELTEIQSINPVLQGIVEDDSVLNIVRARARELMKVGSNARSVQSKR
jgi:hypothetical protein